MAIDIEALKAGADLVSIVGSYVPLKKRGAEYVGCCVAHDDKTPSMWVVPAKGLIHCFSCGFSADVIEFVMHMQGVEFKEACRILGAPEQKWEPKAPIEQSGARHKLPDRVTSKPPPDAGEPAMRIGGLGEPVKVWTYWDADSTALGYVARYESDGRKEFRCWTWGARGDQPAAWGCGHWNQWRPLYGLDALHARPAAPVLVVEGEKAADAASALLKAYAVVTWPGGAQSWHKAEWKHLSGRKVLLWPDNDAPGIEAMTKLAPILGNPGPRGAPSLALEVKIIDPTGEADGFDAADWTGTTDELIAWAKPRAKLYAAPQAPEPARAGKDDLRGATPPPITSSSSPAAAAPSEPPPPEFPAEASDAKPPKQRKPRLSVVGNTALAPDEDAEPLPAAMGEDALADHFADTHGERWRHVKAWGAWLEWRGDGWHRDETGLVDRLAVQVTRQAIYWQDALSLTPDAKRRVNSKRTAGNLRDMAAHDRRIAATVDQWDTNPWLLGVPGGVVDLEHGTLTDARSDHYITKRTACAPAAGECKHWLGLLDRVTQSDASMLEYLQRWCGYILTGETREECFAFIYGPAQTGKSTFIRVISEILGDYHKKASMETFTESRHERHAEELAVLVGARLVTAVETEEGKRWNESRIKALTGRDRIRARFMRENSFEFEPQFKLLIAGNHAPHLRNVDEAMRRRLHIIPFTNAIPMEERDDKLAEKLRAEYPQILAWMIRGAIAWRDAKLGRPEQIAQAVDSYLESEDTLGEWLAECVDIDKEAKCQTSGAYKAFKSWSERTGEYAPSQKRFVQAMRERGFDTRRSGGKRFIGGIALKTEGYDAPPAYDIP